MFADCGYMSSNEECEILYEDIVTTDYSDVECEECGAEIEQGEDFELVVLVNDGAAECWITCVPCKRIRESLFRRGWVYGKLWAYMRDTYGLTPDGWVDGDWPEEPEKHDLSEARVGLRRSPVDVVTIPAAELDRLTKRAGKAEAELEKLRGLMLFYDWDGEAARGEGRRDDTACFA